MKLDCATLQYVGVNVTERYLDIFESWERTCPLSPDVQVMALDFIIPLNSLLPEVLNQHLDLEYEGRQETKGVEQ